MNKTLNQLRDEACHNAITKGFYDILLHQIDFGQEEEGQKLRKNLIHSVIMEQIVYIHSELSEAVQCARDNKYIVPESLNTIEVLETEEGRLDFFINHIKDSFEDELADTLIRILSLSGLLDIDIEKHVELKMKYNKGRGIRHDRKH